MSREKEDYRANLEILNTRFPDHDMLSLAEVMQVTGYKTQNSVKRHLPFVNGRLSKAALARYMCG